jgi:hypothetical protein
VPFKLLTSLTRPISPSIVLRRRAPHRQAPQLSFQCDSSAARAFERRATGRDARLTVAVRAVVEVRIVRHKVRPGETYPVVFSTPALHEPAGFGIACSEGAARTIAPPDVPADRPRLSPRRGGNPGKRLTAPAHHFFAYWQGPSAARCISSGLDCCCQP